jgi:hypothetical protein
MTSQASVATPATSPQPMMPLAHGAVPANTKAEQPTAPRMNATVALALNIEAKSPTATNATPTSQ